MSTAASISVAHLRWLTSDGRAIFDDLNLNFRLERAGLVGRNGVGKSTLLKLLAGELRPLNGRVMCNGTISTLRQIVQISPDETIADLMGLTAGLVLLHKAEIGTATIEELAEADWSLEARAAEALAQVGLDAPFETPLAKLSGGQRTRAALAGAVFVRPDFLLLDEPTNDLDRDGRRAVRDLLRGWRAGAIVVSHDRELLEEMDAIIELTTLGATRYGGNWSAYRARKATELAAAEHDAASAERRMMEVTHKAQQAVERQQRRDSAGSRKGARGDLPRILIGGRRDRAEKSGGENARLAERQRTDAARTVAAAQERIERIEPLSINLALAGLAPTQRVLEVEHVTFGYEPDRIALRDVSLAIAGPERVSISGANGSGKSTLLGIIAGSLAPWSGSVAIHVPHAFFDQRVSLFDPAGTIVENFARLNPYVDNNGVRAALARFQFRAEMADRRVGTLSGGQILRAGLACVLGGPTVPQLLLLDEPTNHLDLDTVAAVEAGLRAYDGALLIVSHDTAFLDAVGIGRSIDLNR
ncbi:ABC-F family ATP-binding cassette domain-containing protein [Martelella soudanensis]|uniref:ABC-F family ATP-binding cassette domain-containing protein n=1 Tax=unclassified Martelella TaxID=2629616 RepID=UPI0015DE4429|nr:MULTISPECIES: ABC-F family ATP-binding cassette domain-containing protein [unclassified Martelella]